MKFNKTKEYDYYGEKLNIGFIIFPYQLSIGLSLRYLFNIFSIRIYFLFFKFFMDLKIKEIKCQIINKKKIE